MVRGDVNRRNPLYGVLLAGAVLALAPATASAAVSCEFTPGNGELVVSVTSGTNVTIGRGVSPNTDVLVDDASNLSTPEVCVGGTPTLATTSQIEVEESGSGQGTQLQLNFVNGRLEPGLDAEAGTAEIEVIYETDTTGSDQLFIDGATEASAQSWRLGMVGANAGANLNGDGDVDDVTVVDLNQSLFQPGTGPDTITGDGSGSGSFTGALAGRMDVFPSAGDDTITAGNGTNNSLSGGADDDTITGGTSNDAGQIDLGNDSFDGGPGIDFVSYSQFNAVPGVTLNMGITTPQNTVGAGTDTVSNVENIVGSNGDDTLFGTGVSNLMFGGNSPGDIGDDTLFGLGGNDELFGRPGDDILNGGIGDDDLYGEPGSDTVSFATTQGATGSSGAVTFSLALDQTNVPQATGGAGSDTLLDSGLDGDTDHDVENLTGSSFAPDMLTGNGTANVITAYGDGQQDVVDCVAGGDGDSALLDELSVETSSNCETVDNAPQTSYMGAGGTPDGAATNDNTPSYDVTSDEIGPTFEYRVDAGPFQACTGACTVTTPLPDGVWIISVRAVDDDENLLSDASPVSRTVTVDTTPPDTNITAGPAGATADNTPTFSLGSTEAPPDFECRIDGGGYVDCASPFTAPALADGAHTLEVRAVDGVSNVDPTPATRSFSVDTTAPNTTASGPAKLKLKGKKRKTATATYALASTESGATLQCSLDGGAFAVCSTSHSVALRKGTHTLSVRATDAAGNVDASPATVTTRVVKKKKKKK